MKNRFGSRNLLFRWVSRHSKATTLFRFSQQPQQKMPNFKSEPGISTPGRFFGHAFLIPQPERLEYLPKILVADDRSQTNDNPVQRNVLVQKRPEQAPAARHPQRSEAASDPIWRRLQNIMHRHQEKEVIQPLEGTTESQGIPETDHSESLRMEPDLTRPDLILPESPQETKSSAASTAQPEKTKLRNATFLEEGEYPVRLAKEPSSRETIISSDQEDEISGDVINHQSPTISSKETVLPLQLTHPGTLQRRNKQPLPEEQPSPLVAPQSEPVHEGGAGDNPEDDSIRQSPMELSSPKSNNQGSWMPPSRSEDLEQDLPLEAVWPVQAIPVKQSVQKMVHQDNSTTETPESLEEDTLLTRREGVETILQSIAPADTTSSKVELITPRRMPPAKALRKPVEAFKTNSSKESEDKIDQSVSRKPDTDSKKEEAPPAVISTEIGNLPEDLWELIDEPSPEISKRMDEDKPQPETMSEENADLQLSKNQVYLQQKRKVGPTVELPQVRDQPKTAVIQRQEAEPAIETAAASSPGSTGPAESQIEELARRIYNEVRKKLRIDWERFRN